MRNLELRLCYASRLALPENSSFVFTKGPTSSHITRGKSLRSFPLSLRKKAEGIFSYGFREASNKIEEKKSHISYRAATSHISGGHVLFWKGGAKTVLGRDVLYRTEADVALISKC